MFRNSILPLTAAAVAISCVQTQAEHSIAREWNEQILSAIRVDRPNPPVHARNLFHLAVAMYDCWCAYDTTSVGYIYHERTTAPDANAARREAISYAAYRILKSRYAGSANAATTMAALDAKLLSLGYDLNVTTTAGTSPAALGNRIAAAIMAWGIADGSNQAGGYNDPTYINPQPPMVVLQTGIPRGYGIPNGTTPNIWQPLAFDAAQTQNGLEADQVQRYVGLTWLQTYPFSHERLDNTQVWIDPGPPSRLGTGSDESYKAQALEVLRASSKLNSTQVIDISPGARGNNPLGTDGGTGRPINPVTNQPYAPNLVKTGDFARVLAEFWADGPQSETPPGHWHVLANEVADNALTVKKIGGTGPVVSDLEWDVKVYFTLSAATHDAACACWAVKRYYQGCRPITAIRYMATKGQSSDPQKPSYHPEGILLDPGVCELITAATAAPGGKHEGVGAIGEIAVLSWPGEPAVPASQTSPVRWMRAVDWLPYQRKSFNTPAFPGYVSGHSTFSRSAAVVLSAITGSPFFPGGIGHFTANANTYLVFERGPSETVNLQWATYYDAADMAGQSRRWGGIHVPEDDYGGRVIGDQTGHMVWDLAQKYMNGKILDEIVIPDLTYNEENQPTLRWKSIRGMFYKVQHTADFLNWTDVAPATAAGDTKMTWSDTTITPADVKRFYRIVRTLKS